VTVDFARSPLEHRTGDLERIGARELAFLAQVSVRTRSPDDALGLPSEPNTWTTLGEREALWLGPDEWLIVGTPAAAEAIAVEVAGADSVVVVSANRAALDLADDARFSLLEQGCSLDLHARSWREGTCAQTLLAHVPVILQERGDATRVFVRPSFAGYLVDWLLAAAS
jgi:sarcosine oxidase subunit gamma